MIASVRRLITAGAFAALTFAPAALRAQASAPDSLAFPRQFVKWVFTTQGDSAFAHAGPELRGGMKSAQGVNDMSARIALRFGEMKGTDAEVQFDEGPLKVYIVVLRFSTAPEPGAFVVAYSPATQIAERASFSSLTNVKAKYPQAKLP